MNKPTVHEVMEQAHWNDMHGVWTIWAERLWRGASQHELLKDMDKHNALSGHYPPR